MHSQPSAPTLAGKSIVVIGGTTGLGLSAALAFVREGANVVVVGRNAESIDAAKAALGDPAIALQGDATEPSTATEAVAAAAEQWGRLDGLYHVAGGSGRRWGDGPLHEISDEGWTATLRLNLDSIFYSNRAATQQFLSQKSGGTILNMGSVLAYSPSPTFFSTHAYTTAKAAIIGMTKASAAYYAKYDIRFNVIAPALVETPMAQRAVNDERIQKFIQSKQPLEGGRVGRPEDLDGAAVFFMTDASRFATGQVLAIDGGWTVTEGQIPA